MAKQTKPIAKRKDKDMTAQLQFVKDRSLTRADAKLLLSEYEKLRGVSVLSVGKAKQECSIFSTPADIAAASVNAHEQYRKLRATIHMLDFAVRVVDSGLASTITELSNALENEANYGSGHMDSNAKEVAAQRIVDLLCNN